MLVVSFNHTLSSYLRRTATSFGVDSRRITWLGFHEWCKRVMVDTGRWPEYQQLWKADTSSAVLELELPRAVASAGGRQRRADSALRRHSRRRGTRFPARLVGLPPPRLAPARRDGARRRPGAGRLWSRALVDGDEHARRRLYRQVGRLGQVTAYRCPDPLARDFASSSCLRRRPPPEEPRQLPLDIDTCRLRWVQTTEQRLINDTVTEVEHTRLTRSETGSTFMLPVTSCCLWTRMSAAASSSTPSLGEATTSRTHSPPQAAKHAPPRRRSSSAADVREQRQRTASKAGRPPQSSSASQEVPTIRLFACSTPQ